jgi:hypothetical protein
MKIINYVILILLTSLSVSVGAIEVSTFGTYTGVLNHEALDKDQLVKLELIPERETEGGLKLQGILTLQFGGYDSTEYISYHYHDIAYNFLTGVLTLNDANQEVYIREATIKNNVFEGTVYSSIGKVGHVRLSKDNNILPTRPLIEPLNGEYRGKCDGDPASLQLYTYRSTSDSSRLGNPYGAYEVKGQLGKIDKVLCVGETKRYCTFSKLQTASYDFFSGSLVLNGEIQNYSCNVNGSKITCDNCKFQRVSDEMNNPQKQYKAVNKDLRNEFNLKTNNAESDNSIAGVYNGYLYHENLNAYQRVQIEVTTYQQQTASGLTLMISAIAKLYFGNSDRESLIYKFTPIPFPSPLKKIYFILSRPDADVDAVLQVTDLKGGVISGQWNSIIFGKVGSFVATKNGDLPNLEGLSALSSVTSNYEENGSSSHRDLVLNLIVNRDRAPLNSDNPFFPLNIKGWIWRKSGVIARESILTSSYDFYTGRIALLYGQDEVIGGVMKMNSTAKLRRLGGGFGTFMQSFELVPFKKKD